MKIASTKNTGNVSVKMLVYGPAGSGKTTLASTIGKGCLIISAEGGLLSLSDFDIDVVDITKDENGNLLPKEDRLKALKEVYQYLQTDEARSLYKWIFVDSITEISQNMVEALQKEYPDRKDTIVLYGENSKRMRTIIKGFRDLPHYNIVFTALSEDDKDEFGRRTKEISMIGKMSQQIAGYLDEVFFLSVDEDDEGNLVRTLITQPTKSITAKDRSGKLDRLEDPNLTKIYNKINEGERNV
jgi:energy-coupling factor transporter ATP-binding protein EcfA2